MASRHKCPMCGQRTPVDLASSDLDPAELAKCEASFDECLATGGQFFRLPTLTPSNSRAWANWVVSHHMRRIEAAKEK